MERISNILPLLVAAATALAQTGKVTYTLETAAAPTSDQADAYVKIRKAMDSAIGYYNTHTDLKKTLTVQYNTDVQTADGSSNGNIRFGSNRSYMQVGTAMHEIAHTIGVGTTSEYKALVVGGVFTGPQATAALREIDGASATLKGDAQHFWPYGINYESEVKGVSTLVSHCKIVQAMYRDMFHERLAFEGRILSESTGSCMVAGSSGLALGRCDDSTSLVRIVAMGATDTTYRIEFGARVLEAPGESKTAGLALGLYSWNGGSHQRVEPASGRIETGAVVNLRLVNSGLSIQASGSKIVQDSRNPSSTQSWKLQGSAASIRIRTPEIDAIRSGAHPFDLLGRQRPRSWKSSFPLRW